MVRSRTPLLVSLVFVLLGCSSSAEARPGARVPREAEHGATSKAQANQRSVDSESKPSAPAKGREPAAPATAAAEKPSATPAASSATSAEALPELKIKLTGMHIGGGPNDALTKRPFIQAIEAGFDAMRACYRSAEVPTKGGTFGVDLRVEREGGNPSVQSVRTAMKGDELRQCLEGAFRGLSFGKPNKPTVLSVSVHFSLEP
ncbi:MAG: hypothetical protein QM784_30760 [Polyangiaceae bacterium]